MDAASQFAHAISVNRADVENDYYAAVDDCDNTSGAGMIGETGYLSATLYRYACVDVNLLNRNLGYDKEAVRLALSTFLNAFALSLPSGKQNSFGHQTLPSFIETVIRIDRPINLVEAYEKPVTTDTIPTSVQRLLEQQADYQNTYGLAAADTFTMADLNARKAMGKEQQETLLTLPQLVTETTSTVIKHSDHHADLLLQLKGPLQSWATEDGYTHRNTGSLPTKSGVIGLVASALGRARGSDISDLAALRFGVQPVHTGPRLTDFQTMGKRADGKPNPLETKEYLQDSTFTVGLESTDLRLLIRIGAAIQHPVYMPYLGRRACRQPALFESDW